MKLMREDAVSHQCLPTQPVSFPVEMGIWLPPRSCSPYHADQRAALPGSPWEAAAIRTLVPTRLDERQSPSLQYSLLGMS